MTERFYYAQTDPTGSYFTKDIAHAMKIQGKEVAESIKNLLNHATQQDNRVQPHLLLDLNIIFHDKQKALSE